MSTFGAAVSQGHALPYQDTRRPFWRERSFTKNAAFINAATFIIHGLFDYNVKTQNIGYLWEELSPERPTRLWLYNGKHGDPHTLDDIKREKLAHPFQAKFIEATHRWFAQYLEDLDAGARVDPRSRSSVSTAPGRTAAPPRLLTATTFATSIRTGRPARTAPTAARPRTPTTPRATRRTRRRSSRSRSTRTPASPAASPSSSASSPRERTPRWPWRYLTCRRGPLRTTRRR